MWDVRSGFASTTGRSLTVPLGWRHTSGGGAAGREEPSHFSRLPDGSAATVRLAGMLRLDDQPIPQADIDCVLKFNQPAGHAPRFEQSMLLMEMSPYNHLTTGKPCVGRLLARSRK